MSFKISLQEAHTNRNFVKAFDNTHVEYHGDYVHATMRGFPRGGFTIGIKTTPNDESSVENALALFAKDALGPFDLLHGSSSSGAAVITIHSDYLCFYVLKDFYLRPSFKAKAILPLSAIQKVKIKPPLWGLNRVDIYFSLVRKKHRTVFYLRAPETGVNNLIHLLKEKYPNAI